MVVVGFDPGSICFGIGILAREKGVIQYLHSEEINLRDKLMNLRMRSLWKRLEVIFSGFPIGDAAIEEGYLGKNIRSMNILAMVRGVVLGFLIQREMNLTFYSPKRIKLAVTGNGNAMKSQMIRAMKILLNLKEKQLGEDEGDALAVAYCHLMHLK